MDNKFFIVGNEVLIDLYHSSWTIIDLIDLDIARSINGYWFPRKERYVYYAIGFDFKLKRDIRLHNLIIGSNAETDHKNRDGLDNRRNNLRVGTMSENMFNRNKFRNNRSGTTGVHFDKSRNLWIASIKVNYKNIFLGRFSKKEDAIEARLKAEDGYLP